MKSLISRRNWLEINLDNLVENFITLSNLAKQSYMPVIKANAYAHGATEVAKRLIEKCAVSRFAVADVSEAVEIRLNLDGMSDKKKSFELISLSPLIDDSNIRLCQKYQIIPAISNIFAFKNLINYLKNNHQDNPLPIWLKINTGMNRLGIRPFAAKKIIDSIENEYAHLLKIKVIFTHLSSAEEEPEIFTNQQIKTFNQFISSLKQTYPTSIGNSAFLLNPQINQFDHITRSGLALYGVHPFYFETISEELAAICNQLKPTSSLKAKIISLDTVEKGEYVGYSRTWKAKETTQIATVSIGYADGYPRHISNGTKVLVNGKIAHTVGRVSMDTLSINLNNIDAKLGEVVTLFGDGLDVNEIAKAANTIPYEILTRANPRGGIVYLN